MGRFGFLVDTYRTERLKTLAVWADVPEARMRFRPEPRARSPLEHIVHQCQSESGWMTGMLGIGVSLPVLPAEETRAALIAHYAACSEERLAALAAKPAPWFDEDTLFFDEPRSRAWVLTRRIAHSAHHRGQVTVYRRLWGLPLYSTYGPTADTGGLPRTGGQVIYRYPSPEVLLRSPGESAPPALPAPRAPVTERPDPA